MQQYSHRFLHIPNMLAERGSVHLKLVFSAVSGSSRVLHDPLPGPPRPPLKGKFTRCHEWCVFIPHKYSPSDLLHSTALTTLIWLLYFMAMCSVVGSWEFTIVRFALLRLFLTWRLTFTPEVTFDMERYLLSRHCGAQSSGFSQILQLKFI